ncbi:MAG TPA: YihY/virulence factor BrkB family protein [Gemmatimonadaceae bacterium]|nr:YihY/virulence factor BrkB family protein [Gemmatimonadaceae bacterium]
MPGTDPQRTRPTLKAIALIPWRALMKFSDDDCPSMAGALAFYTIFSLPALLTVVLLLVGQVVDPMEMQRLIVGQIGELVGPAGASQVETVITHARTSQIDASATALIGLGAVLLGATTAFGQLQTGLNRAWNVKPDPKRGGVKQFLLKRVFSFGVVVAVAFLLLVSFVLSAALSVVGDRIGAMFSMGDAVLVVGNAVLSFVVIAFVFSAMFKLLPDARIAWRDVVVGGTTTAVLFVVGKELIGAYLGSSDPGTAYGAAGSLVLVLVWLYYSSMIVLYGAEFTRVWADQRGGGVRPEEGAVAVVEVEKEISEG